MTTTQVKSWEVMENELHAQFYGTENYYKISPFSNLVVTDGIKHIMDTYSCYWVFTDFVALDLYRAIKQKQIPFAVVSIDVDKNNSVKVSAKEDTDQPPFYISRKVKDVCKELPIGHFEFYIIDDVVLCKSEY